MNKVSVALVLLFTLSLWALAQRNQPNLTMDGVMSVSELKETGLKNLSATQRAALDKWLNGYTEKVIEAVLKSQKEYNDLGNGHWINDNSDGAFITLEDGSLWEVNELDRIDTGLWLATTNITVLVARQPVGDFKYELINTDDKEQALVKYLGSK